MPTADSSLPDGTESQGEPREGVDGRIADLADALRCCCVELMADYGVQAACEAEDAGAPSGLPAYLAVADFSSEHMRGSVGLRATSGVLAQTAGGVIGADCQRLLVDWTCELANQLLGRLKNKLRSFGVALDTGRPRLVGADRLVELERATRHRFSCECGEFSGYLELVLLPGLVLKKRESTSPLPGEGDLILF